MHEYFSKNKQSLEKEIKKIFQEFSHSTVKDYPWTKDALHRFESYIMPGKFIRGLLVLLFSGKQNKQSLAIASAIEIIHSAILIQDDIMDRDEMRRGSPTVHMQYSKLSKSKNKLEQLHFGESLASCVAIIAYFAAFNQFSKVKNSAQQQTLIELFSGEMFRLGLGQMDDVDTESSPNRRSLPAIMRVYAQKTGRYTFALPILLGLTIAGKHSTKLNKVVFDMAKHLGVIFQLRDDILGVFGNSKLTGKSVGGDIREKKITWLYFDALRRASRSEAIKLKKMYLLPRTLNSQEQKWVKDLFESCNVKDHAQALILREQSLVLTQIEKLPISKAQSKVFIELVNFLATREK